MKKQNKKNKGNNKSDYSSHRGRFLSLRTRTEKGGERSFCAKILRESPFYVTFLDVKNGSVVKVAKSSII
jgi:hypothetical protein